MKGSNLLQSIRKSMNDDDKFRNILRGLNETFFHSVVNTEEVESYINANSGFDYSNVFDQYLRSTDIPLFEFYFESDGSRVYFRYTHCNDGFNLPLTLVNGNEVLRIFPDTEWQSANITSSEKELLDEKLIESLYYVNAFRVKE
ncbi:MAG: hypothetical protein IPP52_02525 [Ignavibacteria bacterium]|nr:hypothetical protein [Ignavibacteria bacterium]